MNGAERIKAVHQLVEDNQEVFDSYARLTGGQLSFDDIEGSISNLTGKTEEWQKSIDLTDEQIIELKGSIEAYKDALIVLQDTVTEDALKKNGFSSLSELFSSGDSAAIERAINSVVVKCKSLGMTTEETALQVGLFRNGFSNLNEAMASGDKAMKAVVDNMNEYMHAVVGLPEDVHFTVNAEGDIDIINTAEEGITELDGSEAEVKVDSGDSEETVTTLQELVEHKGRLYLFNGKNIVVDLDKHDKVFTAQQTKDILKNIPHFATGSNNKSFEAAKSNFEYRQKTSVVTDDEALLWWKKVLEDYAKDADVVREANIEIYELTNKIKDDAI